MHHCQGLRYIRLCGLFRNLVEGISNLKECNGKYVCIRDTHGNDFSGRARYGSIDLLEYEWGMDEDGQLVDGKASFCGIRR